MLHKCFYNKITSLRANAREISEYRLFNSALRWRWPLLMHPLCSLWALVSLSARKVEQRRKRRGSRRAHPWSERFQPARSSASQGLGKTVRIRKAGTVADVECAQDKLTPLMCTFIQTVSKCGCGALYVPLATANIVQAEFVGNLRVACQYVSLFPATNAPLSRTLRLASPACLPVPA